MKEQTRRVITTQLTLRNSSIDASLLLLFGFCFFTNPKSDALLNKKENEKHPKDNDDADQLH